MVVSLPEVDFIRAAIQNHLARNLQCYSGLKYAYLIMNKRFPTDMVIISNYPSEWVNTYKKRNYNSIDPVILTAVNKVSPFSWNDNMVRNSRLKLPQLFEHARQYDICNGYTFVLHDQNNHMATLSLAADNIENMIHGNQEKLQMLLIATHEKTLSLYRELAESRQHRSNDMLFSERENDILYWASMGKTYQEIALILGIKTSTVKFHIGNVVRKLGVTNAKHAIRMGIEMNLIRRV
ncbi:LuxR family transcriptional regulator [Musicola paradisiaca]|uniref:Transcriptional regulator, LuxR family n=1 Tax=Musicola paradisiaca (strain Ech703) TaxID=579405 RepID=C6C6M7_MUSP7|nr:LuxR family transcriptional regulator [Musicola paradisiaca]ACS83946.1 transcriptional regulator, LuxR family [Musicola paradisiaca Ech703]